MIALADLRWFDLLTNLSFIFFPFPPDAVFNPSSSSSSLNPCLLTNKHSWLMKLLIPSCFRCESIASLLLQTHLLIPFCKFLFFLFFSPLSTLFKATEVVSILRSKKMEKNLCILYIIFIESLENQWPRFCLSVFESDVISSSIQESVCRCWASGPRAVMLWITTTFPSRTK